MNQKLLFILFLNPVLIFAQNIDFQSPQNIKKFADYLFCDQDYLRAIYEYNNYSKKIKNDSVEFKIALSYSKIGDYQTAFQKFSSISHSSPFYELSLMEKLKSIYLSDSIHSFYNEADKVILDGDVNPNEISRFKNSVLLLENNLPDYNPFIFPFANSERIEVDKLYQFKKDPPYKNEIVAGILSAIIPGAGKIYTEYYGDGVTAFLLTELFSYLAYTNFEHDHETRAWIFTVIGAGFYLGNIYGSVASAQIFNAKINFDFRQSVKLFIEKNNYFIPQYDFCN